MTATLTPPEPDTALDYPDTLLISDHPDTVPLDDGDVPEAFYTTNEPGNHIGKAGTYTRKTSWFLGPGPRKVDTSGVSYAAWVSVAELSASKSSGARRLHQECRLRVL